MIQAIGESQQLGREVNEFLVTLINHSQLIEDNCANESCDTLDAVMMFCPILKVKGQVVLKMLLLSTIEHAELVMTVS